MPIKLHCKSALWRGVWPNISHFRRILASRPKIYCRDNSLEATTANTIVQRDPSGVLVSSSPPSPSSSFLSSFLLLFRDFPRTEFSSVEKRKNCWKMVARDLARTFEKTRNPSLFEGTTIVHPRLRKWVIIGSCLWRLRYGNCLCIKQIPDRYSAVGWADQIVRVCRGYPQNSIAIMTPDRSFFDFWFLSSDACLDGSTRRAYIGENGFLSYFYFVSSLIDRCRKLYVLLLLSEISQVDQCKLLFFFY